MQLLLLALSALAMLLVSGKGLRRWWQGLRALRWLFLSTLFLHLLFTPGRTLWGLEYLSLDGLQRGGVVCAQLALAMTFSALLTVTTAPHQIAAALASLFSPLKRIGVAVDEAAQLTMLILHFIPLLREEALAMPSSVRPRKGGPEIRERIHALRRMAAPLVLRLVERADALAHACARGEPLPGEELALPPLRPSGLLWMLLPFGWGLLVLSVC